MTSVKVAVRVRPRNGREDDSSTVIEMKGNTTRIVNPRVADTTEIGDHGRDELKVREFTFDHSFWSADASHPHFVTQKQVFESLGCDAVEAVCEGYNICVFAYGQTGSGKTYTMMGTQGNPGFIPRFCEVLFGKMNDPDCTYKTQISFLEIYNEKVRDLLKWSGRSDHSLRIREHPTEGPYVQGLSQHPVVSHESIIQLMKKGNINRVTASTLMNDVSSRSHAIFTIVFTQAKLEDGVPSERQSKIHLVDLAGSERVNASGSSGMRLKEGGNINKSLVTLGNVISALADLSEKRSRSRRSSCFIRYRDSKLTYLLKDSLGGNAKTIMIATISPSELNYGESLSTLMYANRAKNIINKPTVNEDPNVRLICELRKEIARLKAQLAANADVAVTTSVHEELHEKEAKMKVLTDQWTDKWRQAAAILQEEKNLELRKEGRGVVLDSSHPHLISLEDDVLSTGVMLYHLKEGVTKIGTEQSSETQDIVICGNDAHPEHCVITLEEGVVTLHPVENAICLVNGLPTRDPTQLNQGALLQLGKNNVFRFNYPAEAEKLKQIRKSLSTLSLCHSATHSSSHTSLISQSLTQLYLSTDSLPLSPGQEETRERADSLREQEMEWHSQQRHLEEKLASKEQELTVLQDYMEIISQTVSPLRMVETSLKKLEDREQAHLAETQQAREKLIQTIQEAGANFSASECSLTLALEQLERLIGARQEEITVLQEESHRRCQGLRDMLQQERQKTEAAEKEMAALQRRLEGERIQLLSQESPLKEAYRHLTQAIEQLHQEEQVDRERKVVKQEEHDSGRDRSAGRGQGEPGAGTFTTDDTDTHNDNQHALSQNNPETDPETGVKVAEERSASTCPVCIRQENRQMENWVNQKKEELWRLKKKRMDLLHSHSQHMAQLYQEVQEKEAKLRARREQCQQLAEDLRVLERGMQQQVEELQEEQGLLQELKARKVQEHASLAQDKAQAEEQMDLQMKQLQQASDAQMTLIQRERDRLLGLQRSAQLKAGDMGTDLGEDDASSVSSVSDADSAATDILLEKEQELEKKTQECLELKEKMSLLEEELKSWRHDQHHLHLNNLVLQKQQCLKALVEQEVQCRLFEENVERERERRREKKRQRAERSREIQTLKVNHQQLLNTLRDTWSCNSISQMYSSSTQTQMPDSVVSYRDKLVRQLSYSGSPSDIVISVPHYDLHGTGLTSHYCYEVKIKIGAESWNVLRRFSNFRELHEEMKKKYPCVSCLRFPRRRWFHRSEKVAAERRAMLECYLRSLVKLCRQEKHCPLHPDNHPYLTRQVLAQFHPFFRRGLFENGRHIAC